MHKIVTPETAEDLGRVLEENLNRVIVAVLPNAGTPVEFWMVKGPFFNAGEKDDMHDAMDFMFDNYDDAIGHAVGVVATYDDDVSIIVYP